MLLQPAFSMAGRISLSPMSFFLTFLILSPESRRTQASSLWAFLVPHSEQGLCGRRRTGDENQPLLLWHQKGAGSGSTGRRSAAPSGPAGAVTPAATTPSPSSPAPPSPPPSGPAGAVTGAAATP